MRLLLLLFIIPLVLTGCLPKIGLGGGESPKEEYLKGKVVGNFPNIPLYPKSRVIESYGFNDTFGSSFAIDEDLKKVIEFYNNSFPLLGWEFASRQVSNDNFAYDVKSEKYQGQVVVNTAADGKQTAITISLSPR